MTPDAATSDVRIEALNLLSNGVYVLTAAAADMLHAATVTWAVQVSFQPALVLVALRRNSHLAQAVRKAHRFALNILAEDQQALAERFFTHFTVPAEPTSGPPAGGPEWPFRLTVGKCPLLTDGMAWLECKLVAEPQSPGDHALMLGEVSGAGVRRQAKPMILHDTPWSYGGIRLAKPMTLTSFRAEAESLAGQLTAWRRDFHAHPELGFEVHRTAGIVASTLGALGCEVRTGIGRTGVIGLITGGKPGPTVMLRADMDALPIDEINDAPYASQVPGVMHACGHDGHVAMGLGAATLLARHAADLPGQILMVFQPAEEGMGGARAMVEDGALLDPQPAAAFGLHLWNTMPFSRVVAQAGPLMAAADVLRILIHGRGGHGALPHEAVDAIAVTGQVLSALQTIVSRNVDPQETAVLTIGTVHGGTAFNIISEIVEMQGTIRTFSPVVRETVLTRLKVLLDGVTAGMGARYDLEIQDVTSAVVNDSAMAEVARSAALQVVGPNNVAWQPPFMVSEDFSEFANRVPACFMLLGSGNSELGLNAPHHNPRFDFDERVLPLGAALLATAAARFLIEHHTSP